jgi:hypothetical protein
LGLSEKIDICFSAFKSQISNVLAVEMAALRVVQEGGGVVREPAEHGDAGERYTQKEGGGQSHKDAFEHQPTDL